MNNSGHCVAERHARVKPADSPRGTIGPNLRELADHHTTTRVWKLTAQKLAAENRRNSEFMAVLSHELRGPLGALRGASWILCKQKALPPEVVEARLMIERQVIQMARLVEDL